MEAHKNDWWIHLIPNLSGCKSHTAFIIQYFYQICKPKKEESCTEKSALSLFICFLICGGRRKKRKCMHHPGTKKCRRLITFDGATRRRGASMLVCLQLVVVSAAMRLVSAV